MRVTEKLIFERATQRTASARTRIEEAVAQTASGLKLEHAWDDPAGVAPVVGHRLAITRFAAIERVAGSTADELVAADSALGGISEAISRTRELVMQLSNDIYSAPDRKGAAAEVRELLSHTIGLLNTRVANRYLFGGNKDDAPPFDGTGAYNGDTGVRQVEVFPGVLQDASIRADVLAKGVGGGVDLLTVMSDLVTALETNDVPAVRNALPLLDDGITQVSLGRAQAGAAMNTVDLAVESAQRSSNVEQETLSRVTDVDVFEATGRLALAQRALDAALSASVRSFELTLLKKMG